MVTHDGYGGLRSCDHRHGVGVKKGGNCCYYSVHAQRPEHRPRRGRGELASIIQHARDGQRGPGACDWQGRPGATLLARVRRPRRKVRLQ